jgi:hypothetical protein
MVFNTFIWCQVPQPSLASWAALPCSLPPQWALQCYSGPLTQPRILSVLQIFNMLNARKIEDELNVFKGIFRGHIFWTIWVLICGFQASLPQTAPGPGTACVAPCGRMPSSFMHICAAAASWLHLPNALHVQLQVLNIHGELQPPAGCICCSCTAG